MLGLVYRVVVAVADSSSRAEIRALVPDAFRVEVEGQMMMQVGAYPTESELHPCSKNYSSKVLRLRSSIFPKPLGMRIL